MREANEMQNLHEYKLNSDIKIEGLEGRQNEIWKICGKLSIKSLSTHCTLSSPVRNEEREARNSEKTVHKLIATWEKNTFVLK